MICGVWSGVMVACGHTFLYLTRNSSDLCSGSSATGTLGTMKPTIIDADTGHELWTAVECAAFSGTARGTFTSYAGRKKAPEPVAKLHGLTLWDSEEVRAWHANRKSRTKSTDSAES